MIRSLGGNTRVGEEIGIEEIRTQHDSVLLSIGLHQARSTRISGSDHQGVVSAVELLRRITLGEHFAVPSTMPSSASP